MTLLESRHVFHWSRQTPLNPTHSIAAALSLAAPITYGLLTHHLPQVSLVVLGALATTSPAATRERAPAGSEEAGAPPFHMFAVRLGIVGLVVTGAGFGGALVGGRGWVTAGSVVGLAAVAAVVGGFSRFAADVTTRFIVFLVIATGLAGDPGEVARWFAMGLGGRS
jgi:hypothetical protein